MYACMHRGLGHAENILEIGCSEIASEAILGQKQGRSSYMARGVLYPIAVHTVGSHLSGVQLSELVSYSNARLAKPHPLFSAIRRQKAGFSCSSNVLFSLLATGCMAAETQGNVYGHGKLLN